jgi:hypothetical protein
MSEPRVPSGVESLIRTLVGGSGEEDRDQRASTFARGLALGALVGAAIAGSTIWQRRVNRREELPGGELSAGEPAPVAEPPTQDPAAKG